ncbi:DNA-directed RNA polymerase subunit beta [Candidatus Roizmanbacteria bacterium RIFCSPLOWO2_01_FULL_42_14]|uniref:DNA-directed RNA polymerase subunit beta n=4 Tax=Candidatus Roizmaniibacteriota TaxID=1752723 RepID=A0A1F7JUX0_9BACT|nr:MAG: DNA-directed RNA polymerase subunit beta [Candidatus Roizmanbacteria bacterium RIFCSPHIGHO2_02_FULL_43_11]OGK38384.1 MAG: DNA-directed RNA polymerase subunit beta [Candidatus Roizmanbacteria bacterium RIFCSPHIGHO2_12_FULL_42_10]OGK52469.1 MAG: DNA-directed RNA polymerase subunit beta [Candidatus Roizmanbacteria bacterium RIFCSPLOWO2_01_FULL_42_14]OGK59406.1 MAG: DNA-directed RNA polymerase subunit beta [Candidatus Roizmanbacteria bacterium RIFCSPLOWO2_02_FULL_43_10]
MKNSSGSDTNSSISRRYIGSTDTETLAHFDLIQIQKDSWGRFLEKDLADILREFFPIEDYTKKNFILDLQDISYGEPRFSEWECIDKKLTYQFPVYLKVKLTNLRNNKEKIQNVYFLNLPKMTSRGTFIINGIERAVISQIVRAPGVYFTAEADKNTGATVFNAEVRPYIGAWLDFTISKHNLIEAKINKKRKFYATSLLRSFKNLPDNELLKLFPSLDQELINKYIVPTLEKDGQKSKDEAVLEIYKKLRPGEPLVLSTAYDTLENLFFNHRRYTLSDIGRYKINRKFSIDIPLDQEHFVLSLDDVTRIISYLILLTEGKGEFDDIDHLSNRRLRTVGELVAMYGIRVGMVRTERDIKSRMSMTSTEDDVTPSQVINSKSLISTTNSFFRTSQLSTIVDQTNLLSEADNLRRLTVGGPGGIKKERASFSIRDIAASQYGRICPIRSPEGPNIGVVTYLAMFARVNKFGFIESPYRKVEKVKQGGVSKVRVTDEIVYMQADDEERKFITHNGVRIDEKGFITDKRVTARYNGDITEVPVEKVDYIDMSPRQVFGLAAALIPFLQHDDAQRALMGTHMMCQAVPLVKAASPYVGTGLEESIASIMGRTISASEEGEVEYVDGKTVRIKGASGKRHEYKLERYFRTNKDVVFDQRPLVTLGQKVHKGDVIIDGPSTQQGELAVGQNLVVAYASLDGLGFEDGFVISERLVKQHLLTSTVMEEYIADIVDTKLGPEELTRDIPHVREEILANLDSTGLVTVGAEVEAGDVLVGKVAPKGEKELSAEERLLRAIFGEKAKDVKDTSLRIPYGKKGVVVDVKIIDAKKEPNELDPGIIKRIIVTVAQMRKIKVGDKLAGRHGNKGVISKILPEHDMPYLEDGTPVDMVISPLSVISRMNLGQLYETMLGIAGEKQKQKYRLAVFEKISEDFIKSELKKVGMPVDGKSELYDGRTGVAFEKPVLVGVGYILKLIHMIEDKFHARSTGPYSLVTQQPLGGKSQMGGQRFGEMEVWALEAHQAPYTLQEMLTVKSDDVQGRRKAFEAIIKGIDIPQSTIPESFNVLVKELNALGLDVKPVV